MRTYKIYTLGCKVNQYDSGKLAAELQAAGLISAAKNADLAVINSCAVTKTAIIKSGRVVKLAGKENPKAKIAVIGCAKEMIDKIFNFQFSIFKKNKSHDLVTTDRARYFIKIQDGCEQFCSYCVIPYTRGRLKSRAEAEVICEIEQAVKAGFREIILSGIHLGLYGKPSQLSLREAPATKQSPVNRNKPEITSFPSVARNDNLTSLLKKLIKIKKLGRIRLSSIEITEVTDELIKLMKRSRKICRHLHIPLQAGRDSVLKRMNRPYTIKNYELRIKEIRKAVPDIAISTDVIVGFPGETEKDFRDTVKFIKQIKFSRLHVFPFSAHERTPAFKMPNQVDEKTKKRRAELLRKLNLKLMADYKKKFKNKELEIVMEQIKGDKILGKSEYYFDVEVEKKKLKNTKIKIGEIIKIRNPL
ncbi:MAG: MiaB/RimO family radical SAM methylthiotransferase [bacterium]|nr:MiaB/RimO family radical SAM methylthiotransferase [bacterium]